MWIWSTSVLPIMASARMCNNEVHVKIEPVVYLHSYSFVTWLSIGQREQLQSMQYNGLYARDYVLGFSPKHTVNNFKCTLVVAFE